MIMCIVYLLLYKYTQLLYTEIHMRIFKCFRALARKIFYIVRVTLFTSIRMNNISLVSFRIKSFLTQILRNPVHRVCIFTQRFKLLLRF